MAKPTASEVLAYLGAGTNASLAQVQSALDAESALQAVTVNLDRYGYTNAAICEALKRRVARNLEMRNLVLGVQVNDGIGTYIGSTDPEIRRLEAPFRNKRGFA